MTPEHNPIIDKATLRDALNEAFTGGLRAVADWPKAIEAPPPVVPDLASRHVLVFGHFAELTWNSGSWAWAAYRHGELEELEAFLLYMTLRRDRGNAAQELLEGAISGLRSHGVKRVRCDAGEVPPLVLARLGFGFDVDRLPPQVLPSGVSPQRGMMTEIIRAAIAAKRIGERQVFALPMRDWPDSPAALVRDLEPDIAARLLEGSRWPARLDLD